MNEQVYGPLNQTVGFARVLSGLDSCTIWALIAFCSLLYIWWDRNKQFKINDAWRLIREQQIASEAAQTEVLKRQTEEIVSMKMLITKFLVKE